MQSKIIKEDKTKDSQTFFFKHQAKFFSLEEDYTMIETKNYICLMNNFYDNVILYTQWCIVNGSIKIIKKIRMNSGVVEFLNKSNKFLVWNENSIELWRLNDMRSETLQLKNDEIVYCSRLNNNENELVSIHSSHLNFWIKNDNDIWIITQKISFPLTYSAEFNKSGNFLLLSHDFGSFLFNKQKSSGTWNYSYDFQKYILDMFCFIEDEKLAHLERQGLITVWHISSKTLIRSKLQILYLDEYDSCYQQCYIRYIQFKQLLFAFNQGKCYFFHENKNQFHLNHVIDFSNNSYIEVVYCFNENYLFIKCNGNIRKGSSLKMLLLKLND